MEAANNLLVNTELVQPADEFNRALVANVHPPEWRNPAPSRRYDLVVLGAGTAGLVTLEDLLEEIVGEIRDEYDVETEPIIDEGNGSFVFSGKVDIDEVADKLEVKIDREGFETVGGFLLARLGRVPAVGETFEVDGLAVQVVEAERRRVTKVRMRRAQPVPEDAGIESEHAR